MAYSYTEKKRIRKDFSKLKQVMELPSLLAIQLDSYRNFTQMGLLEEQRQETGLHAAFKSVFPIMSLNGAAARKVAVGDLIIIIAYAMMEIEDAKQYKPSVIFPDENNKAVNNVVASL